MNKKWLKIMVSIGFACGVSMLVAQERSQAVSSRDGYEQLNEALINGRADLLREALVGLNVNIRTNTGSTALHTTALRGQFECLKVLIEAKADINALDRDGATALHRAAREGHSECVKALIEAGADVTICDDGAYTAFHLAVLYDRIDCCKAFIKYGYWCIPLESPVSDSRRRIFNVLLNFVRLRNQHPELDNLKCATLQLEILSRNKLLQNDLVAIFLDQLRKEGAIKSCFLSNSKEAVVEYILEKLYPNAIIASSTLSSPATKVFLDPLKFKENFRVPVMEGLNERIEQLKARENTKADEKK